MMWVSSGDGRGLKTEAKEVGSLLGEKSGRPTRRGLAT